MGGSSNRPQFIGDIKMEEEKLTSEFIKDLFTNKKEQQIVQYIFEGLNEEAIIEKIIKEKSK